jgi:hypothetical protein
MAQRGPPAGHKGAVLFGGEEDAAGRVVGRREDGDMATLVGSETEDAKAFP